MDAANICSICLAPLSDPVRLETGHVYDRHCICRWFESQSPPFTCPLSNTELGTIELFPVTRRADLLIAVASAPPLPAEEEVIDEEEALPRAPLLIVCAAMHAIVMIVTGAALPGGWMAVSPKNPLLNYGAHYGNGIWRPFTSLLTNANPAFASANAVMLFFVGKGMSQTLVYSALVSATLGAFAAGIAFPDCYFAEGFVLTSTVASWGLVASIDREKKAAYFGVILFTTCISLTKSMNLLSPFVAIIMFYVLVHHGKTGAAAFLLGTAVLCTLYVARIHTIALQPFLAPQF